MADVEMLCDNFDGTDPQAYLVLAYRCGNDPKPSSIGRVKNIKPFCSEENMMSCWTNWSAHGALDKRGENRPKS